MTGGQQRQQCKFKIPFVFVSVLNSAGKGVLIFPHRHVSGWSSLQRAVLSLISSQDVLAATAILPQLGHLLPQRGILPLQEGGSHGDLVLLQPPCITGALCCHVVLLSPGPVFLILQKWERRWMKNKQHVTLHTLFVPLKSAYLLFIGNKHFLGLLDHRLWFQLVLWELVFARVEQLSPRHTGQDQVCGIRLEIDVHLDGIRVDGGRCVTLCRDTDVELREAALIKHNEQHTVYMYSTFSSVQWVWRSNCCWCLLKSAQDRNWPFRLITLFPTKSYNMQLLINRLCSRPSLSLLCSALPRSAQPRRETKKELKLW